MSESTDMVVESIPSGNDLLPEKLVACIGCLDQSGPFIKLQTCSHTEFIRYILNDDCKILEMVACEACHRMLGKVDHFRQEILSSVRTLTQQWQLMTNHKTTAMIVPCTKIEPTFFSKQLKVQVKIEPITDTTIESPIEGISDSFEPPIEQISDSFEPLVEIHAEETSIKIKTEPEVLKIECFDEDDVPLKRSQNKTNTNLSGEPLIVAKDVKEVKPKRKRRCKPGNYTADGKKIHHPRTSGVPKKRLSYVKPPLKPLDDIYTGKVQNIEITMDQLVADAESKKQKPEYTEKPFKCEHCIISFHIENELQAHNERRHYHGNYSCEHCKQTFKTYSSYKKHFDKHFLRYACNKCENMYTTLVLAVDHYNSTHGAIGAPVIPTFPCPDCGLVLPTESRRKQHCVVVHKPPVKCPHCNKMYKVNTLPSHIKKVHTNLPASFDCKTCGKCFKSLENLVAHDRLVHEGKKRASTGNRSAYCAECDKTFTTRGGLRTHYRVSSRHVKDKKNYRNVCSECGERFLDKRQLRDHFDWIHLNIERFRCNMCERAFRKKPTLVKHIRTVHEGAPSLPKDKICQVCGYAFAHQNLLTVHMRRHTGEKPLVCDICDARFAHPAAIYTHRKTMHGVLPKRCHDGRLRMEMKAEK